jgi:hypothetical protein
MNFLNVIWISFVLQRVYKESAHRITEAADRWISNSFVTPSNRKLDHRAHRSLAHNSKLLHRNRQKN